MVDRVLVIVDDLLFWARIHGAAKTRERVVERISSEAALEEALGAGDVRLVVADLGSRSLDVLAAARRLKQREHPPTVLGFVAHVDVATRERALEAGFDTVLPNSQFSSRLEELLFGS